MRINLKENMVQGLILGAFQCLSTHQQKMEKALILKVGENLRDLTCHKSSTNSLPERNGSN